MAELLVQFGPFTGTDSQYRKLLKKAALETVSSLPQSVAKTFLKGESCLITLSLVGPKKIQELNRLYRKKNKPTDVLSFSRLEAQGFISVEREIGDVIICRKVAEAQAKEDGCSLREELSRLTIHGVLHLFGYDHEISPKEEKRMFRLQDKILKKLHP